MPLVDTGKAGPWSARLPEWLFRSEPKEEVGGRMWYTILSYTTALPKCASKISESKSSRISFAFYFFLCRVSSL